MLKIDSYEIIGATHKSSTKVTLDSEFELSIYSKMIDTRISARLTREQALSLAETILQYIGEPYSLGNGPSWIDEMLQERFKRFSND